MFDIVLCTDDKETEKSVHANAMKGCSTEWYRIHKGMEDYYSNGGYHPWVVVVNGPTKFIPYWDWAMLKAAKKFRLYEHVIFPALAFYTNETQKSLFQVGNPGLWDPYTSGSMEGFVEKDIVVPPEAQPRKYTLDERVGVINMKCQPFVVKTDTFHSHIWMVRTEHVLELPKDWYVVKSCLINNYKGS